MARKKKKIIQKDPRWDIYDELMAAGDVIKAKKLKEEILNTGKWLKPCHHVDGEVK